MTRPKRTPTHGSSPAEHVRAVKALLALQGLTMAGIARELGVSKNTVNVVVLGRERSERVRQHLAQRLGEQVLILIPASGRSRVRRAL